ncbi:MAG: glycoside hydrolase family 3 C-terminal domain-containing protein [Pontiellaceae bacterium]|nr:glycoside hydrolase family 3 C-terminal domain-containing protein [Pontiellaceae bacterium]
MSKISGSCLIMLSSAFLMSACTTPPVGLSRYDADARSLLNRMTLDEKIGQMVQADSSGMKDITDIQTYHLGSVLSGGGSDPADGNSLAAWAAYYEACQEQAARTRLGIPILYGIDAVHGHNNVLGAVIFPHNIGLGCTRNPALVEEIGRIAAMEMRATGMHWTFAPCVTVPQDEHWGRTYEGYSEDPELVAELGAAAVRGLQGNGLDDPKSVLACAKHFAGDGGTQPDSGDFVNVGDRYNTGGARSGWDQGDTQCDEATFRRIHLAPYPTAITAGALSIMPSYSSWNGLKCSASKYLLTDVLKGEMGFEGFLVSDWEAIRQIDPDFKTAIGISINAGMDMAMEPTKYRTFYKYLKELVEEGTVPMSRIDDAVFRILRVKLAMGLMEEGYVAQGDPALQNEFGSEAHRAVARQAVRESLVLLKNEGHVFPASRTAKRIHVAGQAADNIGYQCGGWTIAWQGKSGDVTAGGTTVLGAVRKTVAPGTEVTYSKDGSGAEGADLCIVVVGEKPYAEGAGDDPDLQLADEELATVRQAAASGVPVITVLFSGRPIMVNGILDQSDAFIAAWFPGTEGLGVADVLFGDYQPTGKLSFTWPRSLDQIPINKGDGKTNPLFPYGFGLGK